MNKVLEIALGIVTSVGGFLEIGSLATAAQAGAAFGYKLIWAILLGTICVAANRPAISTRKAQVIRFRETRRRL
jgi:hypothetical protein